MHFDLCTASIILKDCSNASCVSHLLTAGQIMFLSHSNLLASLILKYIYGLHFSFSLLQPFLSWFSLVALFLTAKKQEKLEVDFLFLLFPMGYLKVKVIDLSHFPGLLSLFTFAFVYATLFLLLPLFFLISRHSCIAPSISFFKKQLENNDALDFSQFK